MNAALFALIFERPGLRPALLITVAETQAGFWVHGIQHDMDMLVGFIVVGDEHRLVLVPFHVLQKVLPGLDHVLAGGILVLPVTLLIFAEALRHPDEKIELPIELKKPAPFPLFRRMSAQSEVNSINSNLVALLSGAA
jgi:hypothetical protein